MTREAVCIDRLGVRATTFAMLCTLEATQRVGFASEHVVVNPLTPLARRSNS
jgi:hypothetical protein